MISEISLNGKKQDLSKLTTNFSNDNKITIEVNNKNVTVFINNNIVFAKKYQNSIGSLAGIRYKFLGVGSVKSIQLQNKKTLKTLTKADLK